MHHYLPTTLYRETTDVCFRSYPNVRTTKNLNVQYYVKEGFKESYTGRSLNKLEREIEQIYINNLRNECYREQMQSKFLSVLFVFYLLRCYSHSLTISDLGYG